MFLSRARFLGFSAYSRNGFSGLGFRVHGPCTYNYNVKEFQSGRSSRGTRHCQFCQWPINPYPEAVNPVKLKPCGDFSIKAREAVGRAE